MAGLVIVTEACIEVKDRACVDVCPVQCTYEFDADDNVLFSGEVAGNGIIATFHAPYPDAIVILGDSVPVVNLDGCPSCTACYRLALKARQAHPVHAAPRGHQCRGMCVAEHAVLADRHLWLDGFMVEWDQGRCR